MGGTLQAFHKYIHILSEVIKMLDMKHQKTLFTFLLVALATVAFAQSKSLSKANKFYKQKQYAQAIPLFEKTLEEKVSTPVQTKLAFCYKSVNQIDKAEKLYSDIVYSDKPRPITFFHYGDALMRNGKYAAAKFWFEEYLKKEPGDANTLRMIESCDRVNMIKPYFGHVEVTPFSVNSESDDNAPTMWKDQIVFCSDRKQKAKLLKQKSGVTGRDYISLYKSSKQADGTYTEPEAFSTKINGLNKNTGPISFDATGNYAVFSRNSDIASKKDAYSLALYEAVYEEGKWKNIEQLAFCNPEANYMHPALSPDGQKLFFISDKGGGVGGTEIYIVERKEDGTWGRPKNMGGFINTEGHEGFPFYDHKDRLFFSSKGHIGFGGYDVFFTQLQEDGSWSRPVNVGFPINSSSDDISIYVGPDDQHGMFTSGRSGTSDDIFFFDAVQVPVETTTNPIAENNPTTTAPSSTAIIEPQKEATMTAPKVLAGTTEVETEEFESLESVVTETSANTPIATSQEKVDDILNKAEPVIETPTTQMATEITDTEIQQVEPSLTEIMAEAATPPAPTTTVKTVTDEVIEPTNRKRKKRKVKSKKTKIKNNKGNDTEVAVKTTITPETVKEIKTEEVQQPETSLAEVMAEMETSPTIDTEAESNIASNEPILQSESATPQPVAEMEIPEVQQPETSLTEIMAEMDTNPTTNTEVESIITTDEPILQSENVTPQTVAEIEKPKVVTQNSATEIIEPQKINVKPEIIEETLAIDANDYPATTTIAPGNALSEFNGDLTSNNIDTEKTYRVPNADFDFNDVNLKAPLTTALDELAKILKANPNIEIQLIGHTASFGNNTKNQQLSEARAKIAAAYLMDKGIERHRVNHIGFGETQLLNECVDGILCSMDQHKVNERLEVKVMRH